MVRYFYAWTPFVVVGTVVFLSLPWLGLFALLFVSLFALALLAGAFVYVPYKVGVAISHHLHTYGAARPTAAPALVPARRQHA